VVCLSAQIPFVRCPVCYLGRFGRLPVRVLCAPRPIGQPRIPSQPRARFLVSMHPVDPLAVHVAIKRSFASTASQPGPRLPASPASYRGRDEPQRNRVDIMRPLGDIELGAPTHPLGRRPHQHLARRQEQLWTLVMGEGLRCLWFSRAARGWSVASPRQASGTTPHRKVDRGGMLLERSANDRRLRPTEGRVQQHREHGPYVEQHLRAWSVDDGP
jgi:hypothetical protein